MTTILSTWFGLYVKYNTSIIIMLILSLTIKKSIDSDIILKTDIDWLNLTVKKSAQSVLLNVKVLVTIFVIFAIFLLRCMVINFLKERI
jgi:hypothetical protein